jgi:hypothetical protein
MTSTSIEVPVTRRDGQASKRMQIRGLRGALAYAQVQATGDVLEPARTSGFTGVTNPAAGLWCLSVAGNIAARVFDGIGAPKVAAVASPEFGNTTGPGTDEVLVRASNSGCGANRIEIHTYSGGAVANDVAFTVILP